MTTAAFADGKVNAKALNHFKTNFKNAEGVEWKNNADYTRASFTWNNQHMEVFYDENGEILASSRAITLKELPINAQAKLDGKYSEYTATEAIELNSEKDGMSYYVSLVKDNTKLVLQIATDGSMSIFKKSHL
ncbi:hypothetical protein DXN05_05655 [Deminuibacter soli]|uniref:Uncharacterized protein n=2 Tax=Deminuibacter soli TaxID=2291815 RepID=A0A3E1NR77_9BACT|nr:hypothetical protein DXN05_05655 [Deminuibacter soli]